MQLLQKRTFMNKLAQNCHQDILTENIGVSGKRGIYLPLHLKGNVLLLHNSNLGLPRFLLRLAKLLKDIFYFNI